MLASQAIANRARSNTDAKTADDSIMPSSPIILSRISNAIMPDINATKETIAAGIV